MSQAGGQAARGDSGPVAVVWGSNPAVFRRDDIPLHSPREFSERCVELCARGARLSALLALPECEGSRELLAVVADDARRRIGAARTQVAAGSGYPALSARLPQAQAFERELFEDTGIVPEGHPWLKPLRRHAELGGPAEAPGPPHPFFRVEGEGIHEVAVGPVHAGIIEPGHFRFQCHGENVLHLEIHLGYQQRGVEPLFLRSSSVRRLAIAETVAGDTAVGHGLAHCMVLEALSGVEVPLAAQRARGFALELERLASHVGDLAALCNDVGYQPGAAWLGRLRGEFLNLLLEQSGNRFGRGLLTPGGVRFGLSRSQRNDARERLARLAADLGETVELMFSAGSVSARFERVGIVSREAAEDLGLVGPVARASGCDRDTRRDHPHGIYGFEPLPVAGAENGDVMARAHVRRLEAQHSLAFVRRVLAEMDEDPGSSAPGSLPPDRVAVALVEGWRGEIAHVGVTAGSGDFVAYKFVDPSFHNWYGLGLALRDQQISDFPLCNKSFNLSYAGHDL